MMSITVGVFGLVMTSVLLNASAQLLLKLGVRHEPVLTSWSGHEVVVYLSHALVHPFFILGIFSYIFSLLLWILCLVRLPLSTAYPMLSLGYVVSALLAYCILQERPSLVQWLGLCIIMLGVFLVASDA